MQFVFLLVLFASTLAAQNGSPVALVTEPGKALLTRAGTALPLSLRVGDLLFVDDRLTISDEPVTLWFCPSRQEITLESRSTAIVESLKLSSSPPRSQRTQPLGSCVLPSLSRAAEAEPPYSGKRLIREKDLAVAETLEAELNALPPSLQEQARRNLEPLDSAIAATPKATPAHVARASVLRSLGLHGAAAREFQIVASEWSGLDWPRRLVHEEEDQQRKARPNADAIAGRGKVYALSIGVSRYPHLSAVNQLRYADRDARVFSEYLQSARGGNVPVDQIELLTNDTATVNAIRTAITTSLQARAGKDDTAILFLAAHGAVDSQGAYILGSDSDIEDLKTTALPMLEIQRLLEGELGKIGRVLLYIDVCHAGSIGAIRDNKLSRIVQILARLQTGESFGLMATGPGENSVESERFGGGHGAFSYFLVDGLNGAADQDGNHQVDAGELSFYVTSKVREATRHAQNPRPVGDMPSSVVVVTDIARPGIELGKWTPIEEVMAQHRQTKRNRTFESQTSTTLPMLAGTEDLVRFENALRSGDLLPPTPENALDLLQRLKKRFGANRLDYLGYENRLWVALLDAGQSVMLRYIRGDQNPQRSEDFERGRNLFLAALAIDPEALAIESRALFCEARAHIFARQYEAAIRLLERAARVDPRGAYVYNALGIAYLEQGKFSLANDAFRDAIRLAPLWIYPQHNLALTLTESGGNTAAIAAYKAAIRNAPDYWYLPYNLGLLFQRLNKLRDAERAFRSASAVDQNRPEPYNALGFLKASKKKKRDAEQDYRTALEKNPNYLPAKHNLALLLVQDLRRKQQAVVLLREVLKSDPSFLPSGFSLAEALEADGKIDEAREEYRRILSIRPGAESATRALARLQSR